VGVVTRRRLVACFAASLAAFAVLAGCRAIAGYHELDYQPAGSSTCAPIELPASGAGRIRIVNAGTVSIGGLADFCIRASGSSAWSAPIFAGSGPTCHSGLPYASATVPFAVPAGAIDVAAIQVGGSCATGATATATSIAVGDSTKGAPVVTVVRMGGGAGAERIVARSEDSVTSTGGGEGSRIRVLNALSSSESINAGIAASSTLPQTIGAPVFAQPIAPGGVESAGSTTIGTIDAQGYVNIESFGASLGLVFANETSAFAAFTTATSVSAHTIFAIGDSSGNAHPIRGLVCDESTPAAATADASTAGGTLASGLLASCALTTLPTLAIDTINVSLYGGNAPFEAERRSAVYAKVAARQADVMCIVEAYDDRDGIAAAAKTAFPYSYELETIETTPPTDPSLADGGTPLVPAVTPCSSVSATTLQNIYACIAQSCSTTGDVSGTLAFTDLCLGKACALPFSRIYLQDPQTNLCFDCTIDHLTSFEVLSHAESTCNTDTNPPFVFAGQASAMILSRYPLANATAVVLPSSNLRREVLYAEVQLEDGPVDFYCSPLSPQYIDADEPYTGAYGQDKTTALPDGGTLVENGWEDEQDLQVTRVVSFVKEQSAKTGHAAIIAGEWYSGVQSAGSTGTPEVFDEAPEVTGALAGAFVRADPANYSPACDYCPAPTNPYNGGAQKPIDDSATYLFQFPADSTTEESLWGTENDVLIKGSTYAPPPASGMGPAFEYYPREVRVIRPRPQ
jgi:hypothetical protein